MTGGSDLRVAEVMMEGVCDSVFSEAFVVEDKKLQEDLLRICRILIASVLESEKGLHARSRCVTLEDRHASKFVRSSKGRSDDWKPPPRMLLSFLLDFTSRSRSRTVKTLPATAAMETSSCVCVDAILITKCESAPST